TNRRDERSRERGHAAPGSSRRTRRGEPGSDPMRDPSLAPVVLALRGAPTERELDGIGPALAAFRAQVGQQRNGPRRRTMITTALGAKLGATLGGVAAGLAGVTTVVLVSTHAASGPPTPEGAPAPPAARPAAVSTTTPGATATATTKGPDANGPAKHGLCTAWKARSKHGHQSAGAEASVAYQNLVKAAGGAGRLAAFCADVTAPGASGTKGGNGAGRPTGKGTGKPSDEPTKSKAGKGTDKAADDSTTEPSETAEPSERPTDDATGTAPHATPGTAPHSSTGTPVPTTIP
ncbi:MAG TPA: hypothetical protein VFP73_11470, partial [Terrabacter sp.]|nr:hypothetical protein [Terrabacter sp.]